MQSSSQKASTPKWQVKMSGEVPCGFPILIYIQMYDFLFSALGPSPVTRKLSLFMLSGVRTSLISAVIFRENAATRGGHLLNDEGSAVVFISAFSIPPADESSRQIIRVSILKIKRRNISILIFDTVYPGT
jgi:hypothetical protein